MHLECHSFNDHFQLGYSIHAHLLFYLCGGSVTIVCGKGRQALRALLHVMGGQQMVSLQ